MKGVILVTLMMVHVATAALRGLGVQDDDDAMVVRRLDANFRERRVVKDAEKTGASFADSPSDGGMKDKATSNPNPTTEQTASSNSNDIVLPQPSSQTPLFTVSEALIVSTLNPFGRPTQPPVAIRPPTRRPTVAPFKPSVRKPTVAPVKRPTRRPTIPPVKSPTRPTNFDGPATPNIIPIQTPTNPPVLPYHCPAVSTQTGPANGVRCQNLSDCRGVFTSGAFCCQWPTCVCVQARPGSLLPSCSSR